MNGKNINLSGIISLQGATEDVLKLDFTVERYEIGSVCLNPYGMFRVWRDHIVGL